MIAEMKRAESTGQSPTAQAQEPTVDADLQPAFSVIVVNWNTCDYLQECLQSILDEPGIRILSDEPPNIPTRRTETNLPIYQSTLLPIEILVVDNASTDQSVAIVRSRFPEVRLIVNERNLGFAAANNQAIDQARGRVLFLLNPDAYLRPGALTGLARFLQQHPEAAAAGPNVLNPDGTWQAAVFRFPTLWDLFCEAVFLSVLWPHSRLFARKELGGFDRDAARQVDWIQGCALAIRREVWEAVGPFDEGYWMYVEELDWCRRAHALGYRLFFTPDAQVVHYGKRAVGRARVKRLAARLSIPFPLFPKIRRPWHRVGRARHHPVTDGPARPGQRRHACRLNRRRARPLARELARLHRRDARGIAD